MRSVQSCVGVIALLGVPLAFGGCMVGPDFERPVATVTQNFSNARDPRVTAQGTTDSLWWRSFNDPTLDYLVEIAYRQNLPLRISGLRIVEARARLGIATGQQFPQTQVLFAGGRVVGLSQHAADTEFFDRHFLDFQLGFDAAWEIDFWGKYRRGVQAEAAALLASVGDYYSGIVALTAEVARTYVTIRTFEVHIDQARQNARVQEQALDIAESRFRNGATSELDATQARALLESTRATIPQLQIGLQQAKNALSTLLGQPTGIVEPWLGESKRIPSAPAKVAIGVPAELLRRRADIRSAELLAAAQCARIGVAKADLYPSFSLVGTVGLRSSDARGASINLFSPDSLFYSFGPQVTWAFLNYGRIKNAVRVEDARFQQLLVAYHDTVLKAAQEVEDALAGFLKSQEAMGFGQRAVTAAQRSVVLALVEYREGSADYQRVLDAQRSLLDQQNSLADTTSAVATNLIALYKALGGGWELYQGRPVVPERTRREMKERTDWGDLLSQPRSPETKTNPAPRHR